MLIDLMEEVGGSVAWVKAHQHPRLSLFETLRFITPDEIDVFRRFQSMLESKVSSDPGARERIMAVFVGVYRAGVNLMVWDKTPVGEDGTLIEPSVPSWVHDAASYCGVCCRSNNLPWGGLVLPVDVEVEGLTVVGEWPEDAGDRSAYRMQSLHLFELEE